MHSIGEFSRATGLTIKTLRFYHEKGLLVPSRVEAGSGYRYYDAGLVEKAAVITQLRRLHFSVQQIGDVLSNYDDEADLLEFLDHHKRAIQERLRDYQGVVDALDQIIANEREAQVMAREAEFEIVEKNVDPLLMAGVRMRGKYSDCGKGFSRIGRSLGRYACGKPFCLYYDDEYREDDADLEACMPLRTEKEAEGISVRTLPAARCVTLLHRGPYDELRRSYARVMQYVNEKGYTLELPIREVYLKGPGMIFRGNPKKYLTEIQLPIAE